MYVVTLNSAFAISKACLIVFVFVWFGFSLEQKKKVIYGKAQFERIKLKIDLVETKCNGFCFCFVVFLSFRKDKLLLHYKMLWQGQVKNLHFHFWQLCKPLINKTDLIYSWMLKQMFTHLTNV